MTGYTCYHCGKTFQLLTSPDHDRKCPHCGRKMHVCENCRFFNITGCVLGGGQPFVAQHGALCQKFEFHPVSA